MNINVIHNIMEDFARRGYVFSNEQDFQFEFAKALDNLDEVECVKLEALSLTINWQEVQRLANTRGKINRDKKEYTDIVVKLRTGEYIAIELKYKTPERICYYETQQSGKVVTMVQGAYDINAYDFLTDIQRLENINSRYFYNDFVISKGYAIMLTNYSQYRNNDFSGSDIWMNYGLNDRRIITPGLLTFTNGATMYRTTKRKFKAIELRGTYNLQWRDYELPGYNDYLDTNKSPNPGFSYLAIEVNTPNN